MTGSKVRPSGKPASASTTCCSPSPRSKGMTMVDLAEGRREPPLRPEYEIRVTDSGPIGDAARPLSPWERISGIAALRRVALLAVLALVWEAYARHLGNPLMLPTVTDTLAAL